jgi:parallel beta-helix repeat protein
MVIKLVDRYTRFIWLLVFGIIILIIIQCFVPLTSSSDKIASLLDDVYFFPVMNSCGTMLYVGGSGPGNYSNIQDAIDNANDGDTIFVFNGTYYEHVVIDKMIDLKGEIRDNTIVDGSNSGNVFKITADNVSITDFTIQHGGIGVYILYSSNHSICNNVIKDNWEGIGLLQSSGSIISTNIIFSNFFEGINPIQSSLITISRNTIVGNLQGIFLSGSEDNTIYGNNIKSNTRGIEVRSSSNNNHIYHNNFINNEEDNAFDECSNTWDDGYPSGGNYWDDYTGSDGDGDGIGDTPYSIDGGSNKDYYPFMNQSGWNQPPYQPSDPYPANGATNVITNPVISVNVSDPDGDNMDVYFYNESDDSLINVDLNVPSGNRASVIWIDLANYTTYYWYVIADDGGHISQSNTWNFTTGEESNQLPDTPIIDGPTSGNVGVTYYYNFTINDIDDDPMYLWVDWDDGTQGPYIGPYESGIVNLGHTWSKKGNYTIKAKAKDIHDAESEWGTLEVTMPMNKPFIFNFPKLNWLFERFPNAFPILRHMLGL